MNVNEVLLVGNVGSDGRFFANENQQRQALFFNLATHYSYPNEKGEWVKNTDWHQIKIYGKATQDLQSKIQKGCLVRVVGELKTLTPPAKLHDQAGTIFMGSYVKAKSVHVLMPNNRKPQNNVPEAFSSAESEFFGE